MVQTNNLRPKNLPSVTAKNIGRDVSMLTDTQYDKLWTDDKNSPLPHEPFACLHLLWVPCLLGIALGSIWAINSGNVWVSMAWIVYECYIVFDHIPFLCTNDLYTSARFNYERTGPHVFWGMEAMASIVSGLSSINAPFVVFLNLPNHFFFIFSNYYRKIATSKAFTWERKAVSPWLLAAVGMDIVIHGINLRYHLAYLMDSSFMVMSTWWSLMVTMTVMTVYFHREFIAFEHFLLYFGYRPKRFATTVVTARVG